MIGSHAKEKKFIDSLCEKKGSGIALVYGRMGNEASDIVRSYGKQKNTLYYHAAEASNDAQQALFGNVVTEKYALLHEPATYEDAFGMIQMRETDELFLVVDEVQRLFKKDSDFFDTLKVFLKKSTVPVKVIFVSSDVVWSSETLPKIMENEGPLYEGALEVLELNFLDLVRLFPSRSTRECIQMYAITGGVPEYLPCWNSKLSLAENVCRHVLSPRGFLYDEAEGYLKRHLRESSVYETILATMARGNRKLNDIHQDTGFSRAKISVYLKNLSAFGVVEKVGSVETGGWENSQKAVYSIKDTFLNFWFTFVYPHQSQLRLISPSEFYSHYIERGLDEYIEQHFVKVCKEFLSLLSQAGKLPIGAGKIGTWIGKQGQIDILMQDDMRNNVVANCHWSDMQVNMRHLDQLNKSMEMAKVKAKARYLFAAGSFSPELSREAEKDETIQLVDLNSL